MTECTERGEGMPSAGGMAECVELSAGQEGMTNQIREGMTKEALP